MPALKSTFEITKEEQDKKAVEEMKRNPEREIVKKGIFEAVKAMVKKAIS